MAELEKTKLNTVQRRPQRGVYDKDTVHAIIDEARVCHVGIVEEDGQPVVIPQLHVRVGDNLYLHGSRGSRLLQYLESGKKVCVTLTLLDGLVLARSAFHHSMNYRSVVVFGSGRTVDDDGEKSAAFQALVDKVMPGRWNDTRQPDENELAGTALVAISIEVASAKIRTGPPIDDEKDMGLPYWAGVMPIRETLGMPIPDPSQGSEMSLPAYLAKLA